MSQRSVRVNELLKREVSQLLHTEFRSASVNITVTDVDISPDLRNGRVFYSVFGNEENIQAAEAFFKKNAAVIKHKVSSKIVLKYTPRLKFIFDKGMVHGARMINLLNEIEEKEKDSQ